MTPQAPVHRPVDVLKLVQLLTQQRDLYQQLKALSDQQATLIHEGQTDHLLSLLAQRQRLVDALTRLNQDLTEKRRAIPDLQEALEPLQRERIHKIMDEVDGLLHAIIEQDDRDRRELEAARGHVGAQLNQVHRGGAAAHAYRGEPAATSARFTDRQG